MIVEELSLKGVLHLSPRIFQDERGHFLETYSTRSFPLRDLTFVQDNLSFSRRGTLRGLHLQHPNDQAKLVMVITGRIFDVAVDVRVGSPTFGQWTGQELSAEKGDQLFIPAGFAHGFQVLSETAHVLYKCTALYAPGSELSVRFDDPDVKVMWPGELTPLLSAKDEKAPFLKDIPTHLLPVYQAATASAPVGTATP